MKSTGMKRTAILLGLCVGGLLFSPHPSFCKEAGVWGGLSPQQVNQWCDDEIKLIYGTPRDLSPERLKWGEKQLRKMLKDRPVMAPYINVGDDLWNWTVRQFAGEISRVEVQWDPSPSNPQDADLDGGVTFGPPDSKIHIYISKDYGGVGSLKDQAELKGKSKDGPMLWYQTIFELFNARKSAAYIKVCQRALHGKIGRDTFILEQDLVEQETRKDAWNFYENVWINHCQKLSLPYQDDVLNEQLKIDVLNSNKNFMPEERVNELMTSKDADERYRVWSQAYDSLIVPFMIKK